MTAIATTRLPSVLRVGASRIRYEVRVYFRAGDAVFFTFLFPVLLLLIFTTAFSGSPFGQPPYEITAAQYYLPAMLAAGLLLSGLQNMATTIAEEKSNGTLKRLGGAPVSPFSYFIGKVGQMLVTGALQAVVILVVAGLLFRVPLPSDPMRWLTFLWVFVLGVSTSGVLGIALSAVPRSGRSAVAVIIPITLVLQFISGVYIQFSSLPDWLQNVAAVFPLKWMAQGMRATFLPATWAAAEQGGTWNLPGIAIVCGIWLVVGLVLCRFTFRWIRKDG